MYAVSTYILAWNLTNLLKIFVHKAYMGAEMRVWDGKFRSFSFSLFEWARESE